MMSDKESRSTMAANEQDRQQIAAIIEQYRQEFAAMDSDRLKAIWDQDYGNIIYIPQEMAQPLLGWAEVEQYYKNEFTDLEQVKTMTVIDLSVDVIGDVGHAFCEFHFEGEDNEQSHIADGRNTFILHRKSGMWKVIHYHESAPGPIWKIGEGGAR